MSVSLLLERSAREEMQSNQKLKDGAYFCLCTHVLRITQGRFKHHVRAEVDTDTIDYATKYMTKMKAKLSHCDQIKFNDLST